MSNELFRYELVMTPPVITQVVGFGFEAVNRQRGSLRLKDEERRTRRRRRKGGRGRGRGGW